MNYLLGDVAQKIYDYGSTLKLHKIDPILAATLASILLLDPNNTGRKIGCIDQQLMLIF